MSGIPSKLRWLRIAILLAAGLALPRWLAARGRDAPARAETSALERLPVEVEAQSDRAA